MEKDFDFGEALTEQVDAHHAWIIDLAVACLIVVDGENRIAKKVLIGEDKIVSYWCPRTYAELFPDPRPALFDNERRRSK